MVFFGTSHELLPLLPDLAPKMHKMPRKLPGRVCLKAKTPVSERRRWPRLPLAIPVFVRGGLERERGGQDREFLEFATALNVSAGGMLVAVRRSLPPTEEVSLEIPSAPLAALATLPSAARTLRAKVLRTQHAESYNLIGLKFSRPLVGSRPKVKKPLRKHSSVL
jgi:PilZ domain